MFAYINQKKIFIAFFFHMDPKELEYEDRKYVENVIMAKMGIRSRPTQVNELEY